MLMFIKTYYLFYREIIRSTGDGGIMEEDPYVCVEGCAQTSELDSMENFKCELLVVDKRCAQSLC